MNEKSIAARVDRIEERIETIARTVERISDGVRPGAFTGEELVSLPAEDPEEAKCICCFYGKVGQVNRMKGIARTHGMSFSRFMRFAFTVAEAHDFRMPQ